MKRVAATILFLVVLIGAVESTAVAEDLVIAPDDAPMYKLSNLRTENDHFGRSVLAVDYRLTRESKSGSGRVQISGKTKNGDLDVMGFGVMEKSGTARISMHMAMMFGGGNDYEVYFVSDAVYPTKFLVSNIVRIGNPGPKSKARPLTDKEKKSIERSKLKRTAPESIPAGYLAVDQTTKLVPGMPVQAGYYGEWKAAEVISFKVAGPVVLKYEGQTSLESHPREKWIAVDPKVLAEVKSNPGQFEASVRALPESKKVIPDGAVPLNSNVELLPGTPLLLDDHGSSWEEVFAIDTQGDQVNIRYEDRSSTWDKLMPRSKLIITEETLSQLAKSDREAVEKKFASNLIAGGKSEVTSFPRKGKSSRSIHHKQYEIDIPIPKSAQLVPEDLTIEKGTALAGCWANRWKPITAIYENQDGSLHVHWDDYSDAWDCDMTRDQLIIEDKTVRKLRREQGSAGDELAKTLRTWTDVTGKHKVEARYVSRTEDELIIKTDAGREITMPIEKLSESDRERLPAWQDDSDNPFK